jgi:hypothetical protein
MHSLIDTLVDRLRRAWPVILLCATTPLNANTMNGQLTLVDAQQWYTLAQQKLAAQTGALGVYEKN